MLCRAWELKSLKKVYAKRIMQFRCQSRCIKHKPGTAVHCHNSRQPVRIVAHTIISNIRKPKPVNVTLLAIHCCMGQIDTCTLCLRPLKNRRRRQREKGERDCAEAPAAAGGERNNKRCDGEDWAGFRFAKQARSTSISSTGQSRASHELSENSGQAWNRVSDNGGF